MYNPLSLMRTKYAYRISITNINKIFWRFIYKYLLPRRVVYIIIDTYLWISRFWPLKGVERRQLIVEIGALVDALEWVFRAEEVEIQIEDIRRVLFRQILTYDGAYLVKIVAL